MYNTNNYGFNPYGTYIPQRAMQQPIQQPMEQPTMQPRQGLQGKFVDSIETARSSEYILDGSLNFFALTDNSAVITKQLQNDGTTKLTIFKPIEEQKDEKRYITKEDMEKALKSLNIDELDDLKEELKEIRNDIKYLKKKKSE